MFFPRFWNFDMSMMGAGDGWRRGKAGVGGVGAGGGEVQGAEEGLGRVQPTWLGTHTLTRE